MWNNGGNRKRQMQYSVMNYTYRRIFILRRLRLAKLCIFIPVTVICIVSVTLLLYTRNLTDSTNKMDDGEYAETLEPVDIDELHDKWIVVTSTSHSLTHIDQLARIDGWRVLVVLELDSPIEMRNPAVVYLGVDDFNDVPFHVLQHSSNDDHHSRRLVGYLYAIHHGALYIYDIDDGYYPVDGRLNFNVDRQMIALVYRDTKHDVMNPYAHFGQPSVWPTGYPLEAIRRRAGNTYTLCNFWTPCIQQGFADLQPDVDTIFELTRTDHPRITFDPQSLPFVVPEGVLVPVGAKSTLFKYEAFWALWTPSVSFGGHVSRIVRGYWAQRLIWLLGQKLAIFPQHVVSQAEDVRESLDDFVKEIPLYVDSARLVTFVKEWQCNSSVTTFFQCVVQLSRDLAQAHFWSQSDAELLLAWLRDLRRISYQEPFLFSTQSSSSDEQMCIDEVHSRNTIYYSPNVQMKSTAVVKSPWSERAEKLTKFCEHGQHLPGSSRKRFATKATLKGKYDNVLLVIVVDGDAARTIPMLDNLYYDHFPNIAYCGQTTGYEKIFADKPMDVRKRGGGGDNSDDWVRRPGVTFINITFENGYFSYECVMRAIEMGYAVDGYLVLDAHVLFNFWNLELDNSKAAIQTEHHGAMHRYTDKRTNGSWRYWPSDMGYNAINQAFDEMLLIYQRNGDPIMEKYLKPIYNKYLEDKVSFGHADVYYIPASKSDVFLYVINLFFKRRMFVEFAIPTIVHGLQTSTPVALHGVNLEDNDGRAVHWSQHYNTSHTYLHPVKLSHVLNDPIERKLYCNTYVKELLKSVYTT